MATQDGPKYPGIEDGLVFCFDPKNRDCWAGGVGANVLYNPVNTAISGSTEGFDTDETASALTTEGYFLFDGSDDFCSFGDVLDTSNTDAFSISFWMKPTGVSGWPAMVSKMKKYGESPFNGWNISRNTNKIYFGIRGTSDAEIYAQSSATLSAGNWFYIVGTYNGNEANTGIKIYVNGSLDTPTQSGTIGGTVSNNAVFSIASRNGLDMMFDGGISSLLKYNRALSAAEVLTNYNRLKGRFGL